MLRLFTTFLLCIVCLLIAIFSVSNRDALTLRLLVVFPEGITMMACLWILLALAIGMVAGMLFNWSVGGDTRRHHQKIRSENKQLKKQVETLTKLAAAGGAKDSGDVALSTKATEKPTPKLLGL